MGEVISRLGQSAIVLDVQGELSFDVQRRIWALARDAGSWPHVRESVPGMNNLTLIFDWKNGDADALYSRLRAAWASLRDDRNDLRGDKRHEIPVRYGGADGPDLAFVAENAGMSEREIVERHAAADYVVYFLGFQPGFAFLGGLDSRLRMPRRAQPRARVPAGSVGIAGEQSGVYAVQSPGGWQLIGRTSLPLFDARRAPAALLAPGDIVKFVPLS